MYSSSDDAFSVDERFVEEVESLLLENKVSPFGLTSFHFLCMKFTLPLLGLVWNSLCLAAIYQVDLFLFGHVHNYERSCSVYQNECKASPKKDKNSIDTYDHGNYSAPVHAVIGMAGFTLDKFSCMHMSDKWSWYYPLAQVDSWSLSRISQFGYLRGHATKKELNLEVGMHALLARIYPYAYKLSHSFPSLLQFVNSDTKKVEDSFRIIKTQGSSWKICLRKWKFSNGWIHMPFSLDISLRLPNFQDL